MSELINDLEKAIKSTTKEWKKAKKKEERVSKRELERLRKPKYYEVTVREAAFDVMEEAYNMASSNGKYYANARQMMYAARPKIIEKTGKQQPWENDNYFTQELVKDYIERYHPPWKIVYYEKGSLHEPHTDTSIGIGGIEVKRYINKWTNDDDISSPTFLLGKPQTNTMGPLNRYQGVIFIEKEGFNEIIKDAKIAEKYDLAIMSTKGMPTGACSQLLSDLQRSDWHSSSKSHFKIFALHDFDKDGIKILNTLKTGTRLHRARGAIDVIDLGLCLNDVKKLNLQSEDVIYKQRKNPKELLWEYGLTDKEAEFLVSGRRPLGHGWEGQRVELNAMMSEQLIEWLEEKLQYYLTGKVIPTDEVLKNVYIRNVIFKKTKEFIKQINNQKDEIVCPTDFRRKICDKLQIGDTRSWDDIVWEMAKTNKEEK